jgi:hypothetical protein
VTDESGAVPGVTVTATLTDAGLTRMVVTDATGAWVISNRLLGLEATRRASRDGTPVPTWVWPD